MPAILTESLTRSYGERRGIVGVDLEVPEGAIFGFLGPNGAGKTTTIRVLLGFLEPTTGRAMISGRDCWRDSARIKRQVGYLPGDLRLWTWMNGTRALRVAAGVHGRDVTARGLALAERFDLDLSVRVRSMSRGMRQKLGLLLVLAHEPRTLVLDEPTSGLDPLMQAELHGVLREQAATGGTVFFSSHSLDEVEALCDRVAIIRDGHIVADDTLAALRRHAGHQVGIRWREDPGTEPPPCLELQTRTPTVWEGALVGSTEELVSWLAGRPVADLVIGRPDLDTLFRRYYERET